TISFIFIASAISNPVFGHLSDKSRLRWGGAMIVSAAFFVALFPHVSERLIIPTLLAYGFFLMASYPIVEAALMESVPDAVRGRVFGLFITIGGLLGNLAHWIMGRWVESLGPAANLVSSYRSMYGLLALMALGSMLGLPCLQRIRKREGLALPAPAYEGTAA